MKFINVNIVLTSVFLNGYNWSREQNTVQTQFHIKNKQLYTTKIQKQFSSGLKSELKIINVRLESNLKSDTKSIQN